MRTTVDLPSDVHAVALALARDQGRSMSAVLVDLLRKGLSTPARTDGPPRLRDGIPLLDLDRAVTTDDVLRADDE